MPCCYWIQVGVSVGVVYDDINSFIVDDFILHSNDLDRDPNQSSSQEDISNYETVSNTTTVPSFYYSPAQILVD